jgi:hypothetical protein
MKKQLFQSVTDIAASARANGQTIDINYSLPYVAIDCQDGTEYFFQGQEASELIQEAESSKLARYCSVEDIILWQAQGW